MWQWRSERSRRATHEGQGPRAACMVTAILARAPSRATRAARRCAICSIGGGCLSIGMVFSLVMRKHRRISGRKKPPQKSACVFLGFCQSRNCHIPALTELQFLEGPPPGGFSFCYVIGFPSNSCEHRNGRTPESDGPQKKCVVRI